MGEKQTLSEAQVWDDSALQATWNASVKEYQKYHSINARGEDVAEVLKAAAEAEIASGAEIESDAFVHSDEHGDGEDMVGLNDDSAPLRDEDGEHVPPESGTIAAETSAEQMNGLPMPQALIAQSTHDEKLKNLMMSWYWAGYYTGFYEGQQQGHPNGTSNGA